MANDIQNSGTEVGIEEMTMLQKKLNALEEIKSGASIKSVSDKYKVTRQTLYNWCNADGIEFGLPGPKKGVIMSSILDRLKKPTPNEVYKARVNAGLTQKQAAMMVSKHGRYHTWRSYEVDENDQNHNDIPMGLWELFLLLTRQHPHLHVSNGPAKDLKESD